MAAVTTFLSTKSSYNIWKLILGLFSRPTSATLSSKSWVKKTCRRRTFTPAIALGFANQTLLLLRYYFSVIHSKIDAFNMKVTTPSLGVGYEVAYAEALGKKVLCLFRVTGSKMLSAMVRGCPNFTCKDYETVEEAKQHIKSYLEKQT